MRRTKNTPAATDGGPLALYRDLADLQRESDRLRIAAAARAAYEDVVARNDELKEHGTNLAEFAAARDELAAYGGRVPDPVDPAELLAYARRKVDTFRRLVEAGVPDAAEALAEAEEQLAEEEKRRPADVELVSFGYLHGDAPEAHLVVDMRQHFRDPHVNPGLRELTADHELVMRAVFDTDGVSELALSILAAVEAFRAGPSAGPVRVAIGCAGGRHRSAAMVNYLSQQFHDTVKVNAEHRDIHRPVVAR